MAPYERSAGWGRWEHRVQSFGGLLRSVSDEDLEAEPNAWGEKGWRLVAAYAHDHSSQVTVIACRPQTASTRRERGRLEA